MVCASSPCADHHAGDAQQLQLGLGHGAQSHIAVHTADGHVQHLTGEVLHGGHLHQPVHQNIPAKIQE